MGNVAYEHEGLSNRSVFEQFRRLVEGAAAQGLEVLDRCNLTVLLLDGQEDTAEFLAQHQVEVVASLPCYSIENVEITSQSVLTNTPPLLAYRGAGRPESTTMLERMIDLYSYETAIDPAVLRRKNLYTENQLGTPTATGVVYDTGDYLGALESILEAVDYDNLRALQQERRHIQHPKQLGLGISSYVEITNPGEEGEYGCAEFLDTGRLVLKTGSVAQGHSHATGYRDLASRMLGIDARQIDVLYGDTDLIPRGTGTGGSKSTQIGGSALHLACEALIEQGREQSAELLGLNQL